MTLSETTCRLIKPVKAGFIFGSIIGSSALLGTAPAAAQIYLRGDIGGSLSSDAGRDFRDGDLGSSVAVQGGVGMVLPFNLRSDLTLSYRPSLKLDQKTGVTGASADFENLTVLANLYYDFDFGISLRPYVGFGIGYASNRLGSVDYSFNGSRFATEGGRTRGSFAYAAMAGLSYPLLAQLTLDAGYRYLDAGSFETSGRSTLGTLSVGKGDFRSHELNLGLRYSF